MKYRPEIDGLRTIAVLSVIIYHAQIVGFGHSFFKGGFVGVDIFFVISGYLISRILLSEFFEKGKISFLQFYERRARRILPILFIVFLASFPLAYKYLLPNQFIEYAQSILSATFFGSNIFFYFTNTQYGAEDSLLQPFLHIWSLGVEEQFYILFPIVLLLAYKFAKNHLITIIAVLILISLQYADWQSTKNTQLNFFMLTSRLWELGIGSLLAFYELKYGRVKHELLNQTMPLLGLAMITYSIIFFNNQTPHPSLITLLPTIGTALIILYSVNKTDLVGKVLSWKPIVGVGLISYSMYLWHYPLFAFARIGDSNGLHNDEKYLLILLTIVLSIISYFLIEKPFRNRQFLNGRKFSAAILILLIAVIGVNWKVVETKGFEERVPKVIRTINADKDEWEERFKDSKKCFGEVDCQIGNNKFADIYFVGDSILQHINRAFLRQKININDYRFHRMNSSSCYFFPRHFVTWQDGKIRSLNDYKCDEAYYDKRINKIEGGKNQILILGGMLDKYLNSKYPIKFRSKNKQDNPKNALKDFYITLLNKGYRILLIKPYPLPYSSVPKFIQKNIKNISIVPISQKKLTVVENERMESNEIFNSIKHQNFSTIDVSDLFCDESICSFNDENILYIYDANHPSYFIAEKISLRVINKLKELNWYHDD